MWYMELIKPQSYYYIENKSNILLSINGCINYSISKPSNLDTARPNLTISNLQYKDNALFNRKLLSNKGSLYSFINKINRKQYIVSAKDLQLRLNEHLSKRKSNSDLQAAMLKYG